MVAAMATIAHSQVPPEVAFTEDFQALGTQANPPGWVDNSIGESRPVAGGLYKTWPDPTQGNKAANVVYGTKQASGKPEGNNPRIGTFSTLTTKTFSAKGRFEYRGRFIRTNADTHIGFSFLSSYPEKDSYYLLGLWSRPGASGLSMQLFSFGAGTLSGTVDSGFTPEPNRWYRFAIQVDEAASDTAIRARFWTDDANEPVTFAIDAKDSAPSRLTSGRIGIWSAVKGEAYVDDLWAKSPVDHLPPVIEILESGSPLADGAKFNRDAVPEIKVTDDISGVGTVTATLDGAPYVSKAPVATEGPHVLKVHATDNAANSSSLERSFVVDKTAPQVAVLENGAPFPAGFHFNRNVVPTLNVVDVTATDVTGSLDGQPYSAGTAIANEGTRTLSFLVTDAVGWSTTAGPIVFVIDKTAPALTFTSHQTGGTITSPRLVIKGFADDAQTVTVNGVPATVDTAARTFSSAELTLLEGENAIVVRGIDRATNSGTATLKLNLDTRSPELTVTSPTPNSCSSGQTIDLAGTVSDPRVESVTVRLGETSVPATLDQAKRNWTASITVATEGRKTVVIEARDSVGHVASRQLTLSIDRTAPVIEVTEAGAPFTAEVVPRPIALFVRGGDADPNVVVTAKLDGSPYTSGTLITAEGQHTLDIAARDCAGKTSERTIVFRVDTTAPTIRNVAPATGGRVGSAPASVTGLTDTDVEKVEVAGTNLAATPAADGTFILTGIPFTEGTNRFTFEATDRAGHTGSFAYTLGVKTNSPVVEIVENGVPISSGARFNRPVTPVIRVSETGTTIAATLNGSAFTSGTTVSESRVHELVASATDSFGHRGEARVSFTIDREPPAVKITAPASGVVPVATVDVTVTAGDAKTVTVNGVGATKSSDGAFLVAALPLDFGENAIVALGFDDAGNAGRDEVVVTREGSGPGIIITYPPERMKTNRLNTDVAGRLLTPDPTSRVTIKHGSADPVHVPIDVTGGFRLTALPLQEGENPITATAISHSGRTTSIGVHVSADFTPPLVKILESGQPLTNETRFADRAVVTAEATDQGTAITPAVYVDGSLTTIPITVTATGSHTVIAIARDDYGNESRIERSFVIGASSGAACVLNDLDFADGAIVTSTSTLLTGRTGGAAGIKVNGVPATVISGSFCAPVELSVEGANQVLIECTDATGTPSGGSRTITLNRVTGGPSISIAEPAEGAVTVSETIAVSGTLGSSFATVEVNGVAATVTGTNFTAPNIRLAGGMNVIVARALNAAGRMATASRRVVYLKNVPSIAITSPVGGVVTGTPRIDVSGTWSNLEAGTIAINGGVATPVLKTDSHTTGRFLFSDVSLNPGSNTVTVSGRDLAGRTATTSVTVTLSAGKPSIAIAQPADNTFYPSGSGDTFTVSGSFTAAAGSVVDVAGTSATIDAGAGTFTAPVRFSTLTGGTTPVVVRLIEPSGAEAFDVIRVTKLAAAPDVVEVFPAANAVEVGAGVMPLVLFSAPMDRATLEGGGFRFESAGGATVNGTLHLDREVLTFAPSVPLISGQRYTLRVTAQAKDISGNSVAQESTSSFTVSISAPETAPVIDAIPDRICAQSIEVKGTAPAGARLRIDLGSLSLTTAASSTGAYLLTMPLGGRVGCQVVRVRVIGSDGTLSPAGERQFQVDCAGPQVTSATFDRTSNKLQVLFSKDIKPPSSAAFVLQLSDGRTVANTAAASPTAVTVTPSEDLKQQTFTLSITSGIVDLRGMGLALPFTKTFEFGDETPRPGDGSGFINGEVYDATTGRPLAGATVAIESVSVTTSAPGRYTIRRPEGPHAITVSAPQYTTAWRQIVVPPGAGVVPIDVRLSRIGVTKTSSGAPLSLIHGGEGPNPITRRIELSVPSTASGAVVSLTSASAQSLPGLLPLGWSPLSTAVITASAADLPGSTLKFTVPLQEITNTSQNITAARYDESRDEWLVLSAVANVASDGTVSVPISRAGTYGLVFPDKRVGLLAPSTPTAGAILTGVTAPAVQSTLQSESFTLTPEIVAPNQSTTAVLTIKGTPKDEFPSGTAVQAYIDEELKLADGRRLTEPPFATDLILYRDLSGTPARAEFLLEPSAKAREEILEVGFEHIRILPYPGRLERGTLIGPEGGRVPSDGNVSIEIPAGATTESLHATAASFTPTETVAGFRVLGGFSLTLQRTATDTPPEGFSSAAPELLTSARATVSVSATTAQVILAEILPQTAYGQIFRLAAQMERLTDGRYTTKAIDRTMLPIDGVIREGRYLILAAEQSIAFATGTASAGAFIKTPTFGVADIVRPTRIFNLPVPAAAFSLIPRTSSSGEGSAVTFPAPQQEIVNVGEISITPQPPTIVSTLPTTNAVNVSIGANVQITFSKDIDPVSAALVVTDAVGSVSVSGPVLTWRLSTGTFLRPSRQYTVTVPATIRGTNGAMLGQTYAFTFTTITQITSSEVRPERIRITIPDSSGYSKVIGDAGALPTGWQAVPVRRARDFSTRFQATAAGDGSFSIAIAETVSLSDLIDLQAINTAGAIAAIIPLTPFVSEDGRAFVAQAGSQTRFTSPEGITITVPANAFEQPTLVDVRQSDKTPFATVPKFDDDLNFSGSVNVQFDGVVQERLQVEIPAPSGADPARLHMLGWLGQSVLGPRVMIVDTMRVAGGKFTTEPAPGSSSFSGGKALKVGSTQGLTGADVKKYLLGVNRSGIYAVVDVRIPAGGAVGWLAMDNVQAKYDLFWDTLESLYAAFHYLVEGQGRVAIPIITNRPFKVVGVDASTGLQSFVKAYDPFVANDPGTVFVVSTPEPDKEGPYPVGASPARVEVLDSRAPVHHDKPGLVFTTSGTGTISVTTAVSNLGISLLNVSKGIHDLSGTGSAMVSGAIYDRVVAVLEERDVDPSAPIYVIFSEPINAGSVASPDAIHNFLAPLVKLQILIPGVPPVPDEFKDVAGTRISLDGSGRRVTIHLPGSLQRGGQYRVGISKDLGDSAGMKIGEIAGPKGGLPDAFLYLQFRVRAPGGHLASFNLQEGQIRDISLSGNLLFVAALEGGLLAYDTANPAAMIPSTPPVAYVPGGAKNYWAVASDRHGRVYTTSLTTLHGALNIYDVEDFRVDELAPPPTTPPSPPPPRVVDESKRRGYAFISWAPGTSIGMGFSSATLLSDRAEAIPRKFQILLQDDEKSYYSLEAFTNAVNETEESDTFDDASVKLFTVKVPISIGYPYRKQRITIENTTRDLRWSADATTTDEAIFKDVIGSVRDHFRIVRNDRTYGAISLFGYGVGIYDLNAIESNDMPSPPSGYTPMREQVRLTPAALASPPQGSCSTHPPASSGAIPDLTFTPESAIFTAEGSSSTELRVVGLEANRGLLDLRVKPPQTAEETAAPSDETLCHERAPHGLLLHSRRDALACPPAPAACPPQEELQYVHHPRFLGTEGLIALFREREGRSPSPRFTGASPYRWHIGAENNKPLGPPLVAGGPIPGQRGSVAGTAVTRDYLLVAGKEYGLLVVEVGGDLPVGSPPHWTLSNYHLADIIWIPGGAYAVRVVARADMAAVVDGEGRVLLVDLKRIDERWNANGAPIATTELFPTAKSALSSDGVYGIGLEDPRIVWKSAIGVAAGATLAPVIDPDTGFLFAGKLMQKTTSVVAAIDPRFRAMVDLGDGLEEVGGVVPLGVAPPANIVGRIAKSASPPNGSLAAFRLEVTLPGAITESLAGGQFEVALESERVFGATMEPSLAPLPPAHLRGLAMKRAVPGGDSKFVRRMRHQRGFNKLSSGWIVALADPRAAARPGPEHFWNWGVANPPPAQMEAAGCFYCRRPQHLENNPDVPEIYTSGRLLAVRPEQSIFAGTDYAYLGDKRLWSRFGTVMADTVREPKVATAAQNPPLAGGAMQETTYLHSAEIETSATDLVAGGRSGWDVTIDRTYRSRTIGSTALGRGWDSPLFRRLRPLPDGSVEYRDGAEIWTFTPNGPDQYKAPNGLFLQLARNPGGWTLTDAKRRIVTFDTFGRLTSESDEFHQPASVQSGNTIRYLYAADGRLRAVADPVGRLTNLDYDVATGLLDTVMDWRKRVVNYAYDAPRGLLSEARLPTVANTTTGSPRPTIKYAYSPLSSGATYNDRLVIESNLTSITDPGAMPATPGGVPTPRVAFEFDSADPDRVATQKWGSGETATLVCSSTSAECVTDDALLQKRTYTLTGAGAEARITKVVEHDVPTSTTPTGVVPPSGETTLIGRTWTFAYEPDGLLKEAVLEGVRKTTYGYTAAGSQPGRLVRDVTADVPLAPSPQAIIRSFTYQASGLSCVGCSSFLKSVSANGLAIDAPEPHRNLLQPSSDDDSVDAQTSLDEHGRFKEYTASGGTDSLGAGAEVTVEEFFSDPANPHALGLPKKINRGGEITTFEYGPDTVTVIDTTRTTTTHYDSWRRPVKVTVTGTGMTIEERYLYDAAGRLTTHERDQGSDNVRTDYEYDAVGRQTLARRVGVLVDGTIKDQTTTTSYDEIYTGPAPPGQPAPPPQRLIKTVYPSSAIRTQRIDGLGRVAHDEINTTSTIKNAIAYDRAGNQVYSSDGLTSRASAFDIHGREITSRQSDGTKTESSFDAWDRPVTMSDKSASGSTINEASYTFTPAGRLERLAEKVDATLSRETKFAWDGGGRTTGIEVRSATSGDPGRAVRSNFDSAGRILSAARGIGSPTTLASSHVSTAFASHHGDLPQSVTSTEKSASPLTTTLDYDTAGNVTRQTLGSLVWEQKFDQSGNLTSFAPPRAAPTAATTLTYDARSALVEEKMPDEGTNRYQYGLHDGLTKYLDPSHNPTNPSSAPPALTAVSTDGIGRPEERRYADDTTEKFTYEGPRLSSYTDRQGRKVNYFWNSKGQLTDIKRAGGDPVDAFEYDDAGRLIRWTHKDSEIRFGDFTSDGKPQRTVVARLEGGVAAMEFEQQHRWNEHGERVAWSMPRPTTFSTSEPWTDRIEEKYDALGNVISIERKLFGSSSFAPLFSGEYRNAGRPVFRTVETACGTSCTPATIRRDYGYEASTSQLRSMSVKVGTTEVAGSDITLFDGTKIAKATILGVPDASNSWQYDARGRLSEYSLAGRSTTVTHSESDFRAGASRTAVPGGSPSLLAQPELGHKIDSLTHGGSTRDFEHIGDERIKDGRFEYQWDEKGDLIKATQEWLAPFPLVRLQVVYDYDGNHRLTRRRVKTAPASDHNNFQLASPSIITDGLPVDSTFVWDAITDRLVAIFDTVTAKLVRQIIHGGVGYDDPIEITLTEPTDAAKPLQRLYPIYDEAGAGNLQVVMNKNGEIVSRTYLGDAYGDDEEVVSGPAIDRIERKARTDANGDPFEIEITLRSTDRIRESTRAKGARLTVLGASGEVLRISTTEPKLLPDGFTLQYTFGKTEWNDLTKDGSTLSIGVTNTLRADAWGDVPMLSAPAWSSQAWKPSAPDLPVQVRESLANLSTWLASIGPNGEKTDGMYKIEDLAALGSSAETDDPSRFIVASPLHALPFFDSVTRHTLARRRWLDHETGTFLSGDPELFADSPNLFSAFASDAANHRDPTGESTAGDLSRRLQAKARQKAMTTMFPRNPTLGFLSLPGRYAAGEAAAGALSTLEFGEHFAGAYDAARRGDYREAVSEVTTDVINGLTGLSGLKSLFGVVRSFGPNRLAPMPEAVTPEGIRVRLPQDELPNGISLSEADRKKMNVGGAGHHVPAVRKARGRPFEVNRTDKTRPTMHVVDGDAAEAHWRLHDAERQHVGPRQGDFVGTDDELFNAYRRAYEGLDDIKVDVRSPNGKQVLATSVTPREAVDVIEGWLASRGLR